MTRGATRPGLGDIIAKISDTLDPVSYSHGPELNWQPWSDQVTLSERAAALKAKRSNLGPIYKRAGAFTLFISNSP